MATRGITTTTDGGLSVRRVDAVDYCLIDRILRVSFSFVAVRVSNSETERCAEMVSERTPREMLFCVG